MEINVLLAGFMAICEPEKGDASSAILTSTSHLTRASTSCLILASVCCAICSSSCCPLLSQLLPITATHAPICYIQSPLPLSTKQVSSGSACFTLPSCSSNYSFLYHTFPTPHLLPLLCPKLLLHSVTLPPFPGSSPPSHAFCPFH